MTAHLADTPVIETERLTLRAPRMDDYPAFEAFLASDRSGFVGGPMGRHEAWRAFGHLAGMWALKGCGTFVFNRNGDDRPIGSTGPWVPEDWPEDELGWTVWNADAEGKGFAYEAAFAARAYAYKTLGWTTAVSYIDVENSRSEALARRLGATLDQDAVRPEKAPSLMVYRHPAPEALA